MQVNLDVCLPFLKCVPGKGGEKEDGNAVRADCIILSLSSHFHSHTPAHCGLVELFFFNLVPLYYLVFCQLSLPAIG